jgi:hypothetical protein
LNGVGTGTLICCTAGISASRSSRFSSGRCASGTSSSGLCKGEHAFDRPIEPAPVKPVRQSVPAYEFPAPEK